MESCLSEAKAQGKSGVCMLGAAKQKAWLSEQNFAKKYGFTVVDTAGEHELLALSLDGTVPYFAPSVRQPAESAPGLTVYCTDQCLYIWQQVEKLREYCEKRRIPARFVHVTAREQARTLPCVFDNWAAFYDGRFVTVNQIDGTAVEKLRRGHTRM